MNPLIAVAVAVVWGAGSVFGAIILGGMIALRDRPPTRYRRTPNN